MNNALLISPKLIENMKNIKTKRKRCHCPCHRGIEVLQIEADLINGVHFFLMKDLNYHLVLGEWDDDYPPPIVNPDDIEPMLWEALAS